MSEIAPEEKSRTVYLRNWRHNNPINVRKNKKTSYWNNPEKHRKKSRETWHKNKNNYELDENGRINDKVGKRANRSGSTIYKIQFIRKYAIEGTCSEHGFIDPVYQKVKTQNSSFVFKAIQLLRETENNPTKKQVSELLKKYHILKNTNKKFEYLKAFLIEKKK